MIWPDLKTWSVMLLLKVVLDVSCAVLRVIQLKFVLIEGFRKVENR